MELYELLDIFSQAGQKLDSLWEFFVTVHLAIYGGLFLFHKMKKHQLVISLFSYISFSLINLRAKIQEYRFYESLTYELKSKNLDEFIHIKTFIINYNVDDRFVITYCVHIVSMFFILILLYFSRHPINETK